jgi:H+/Cl- antiporter ClcA
MIRWLISFPTSRARTKNNPIGAYQQELRYWTRLVLVLVGLVSAIVIWCIVNISNLLLTKKNNFVTNTIRYNNNYNYTSFFSSSFSNNNMTMTNLSTSNFITKAGNVNVTAASHAATEFVINNGTGNDSTNYYGLSSFAYFIGFNILFTIFAFIPVAYRPLSGGSGIAEAKATLNGTVWSCRDL